MKYQIQLVFGILLLFCLQSEAQLPYVEGYFIDNEGSKIECLIKNLDWTYNPTSFEFIFEEENIAKVGNPNTIREFGILGRSRFISLMLPNSKREEKVFLKVLIEGKASLFAFESQRKLSLYYSLDNASPTSGDLIVLKSKDFKRQLKKGLQCTSVGSRAVATSHYSVNSIKRYFNKYNKCISGETIEFERNEEKDFLNISLKAGMKGSIMGFSHAWRDRSVSFGNAVGYIVGIEAEVIAPVSGWNWSLVFQPTYQYYKGMNEMTYINTGTIMRSTLVTVDYQSIELPIGYRHLFFLQNKSRIFIEAMYIIDMPFGSEIKAGRPEIINVDVGVSQSLAFGIGYNYKNKASLAASYGANRQILGDNLSWFSDYRSIALTFGYTFI